MCGLVAVTGSWLMSGIYLSVSVAIGDLCADPAEYLVSQSPSGLPPDVLLYYTQCESFRSNPFTQRLRESQTAISSARNSMATVSKVSLALFKKAGLSPKLSSIVSDLITSERLLTRKFSYEILISHCHHFSLFFPLSIFLFFRINCTR